MQRLCTRRTEVLLSPKQGNATVTPQNFPLWAVGCLAGIPRPTVWGGVGFWESFFSGHFGVQKKYGWANHSGWEGAGRSRLGFCVTNCKNLCIRARMTLVRRSPQDKRGLVHTGGGAQAFTMGGFGDGLFLHWTAGLTNNSYFHAMHTFTLF